MIEAPFPSLLHVSSLAHPPVCFACAQSFMNDLLNACIDVGMSLPDKGGYPMVGHQAPAHTHAPEVP